MGLDLFPVPYPCTVKGYCKLSTEDEIDCERTKCLFKDDNNPRAPFGTYCHFGGKWLSLELDALGEERLAERCYKNLSADQADKFGWKLLQVVKRLRKRYAGVPPDKKPCGAGHLLTYDAKSKKWTAGWYSTFDDALDTVEAAGRWYQKVASCGSDVEARF